MSEVTLIGIDLVKRVFQLHGARCNGSVAFPKRLHGAMAFLQAVERFDTPNNGCSGKIIQSGIT